MKAARRIASPNVGTGNGEMKFDIIEGALTNDFDTVNAALAQDPSSINTQHEIYKFTATHAAVSRGNFTMVQHLLDVQGIDLSIRDVYGRHALDMALAVGHRGIIDILFRKRAEQLGLAGTTDPGQGSVIPFKPR